MIQATLLTLDEVTGIPGSVAGAANTQAQVRIVDDSEVPVTTATVTLNGGSLTYVPSRGIYTSELTIRPNQEISLTVTVAGLSYTATHRQLASFPTVFATPVVRTGTTESPVWSTQMENTISWSPLSPTGSHVSYRFAVGVLDNTGALQWPIGNTLQSVSGNDRSINVPRASLTPGNRTIMLGMLEVIAIPGAKAGSGFAASAFTLKPVNVITHFPNPSPTPSPSRAVGFHIDIAHTGRATLAGGQPVFPAVPTWTTTLNNKASYPVIAEGKVFVMTDGTLSNGEGRGRSLYALDETNGNVVWGPIRLPFGSFTHAAHAYDHGRIFVVDFDGRLSAHSASTGAELWSLTIGPSGFFGSAPTAANGLVYVGAPEAMYAIDGQSGAFVWKALSPGDGTFSAPTVTPDAVYVTAPCHAWRFHPSVGGPLWKYSGIYRGGGRGVPAVFAHGKLFALDDTCKRSEGSLLMGRILDPATGAQVGEFAADFVPAFSAQAGFYLSSGSLTARDQASGSTLWTFTGDGQLTTAPIVVENFVVIASSSGKVYALNADTGSVAWSATTAQPISYTEESGGATVLGGNAVGDGYLVVPAGNSVTAWRLAP